MTGGKCKFQAKWMLIDPYASWLQKGSDSDTAYCKLCMREFSISSRGFAQLRVHHEGKTHMASFKALAAQPRVQSLFPSSSSTAGRRPQDSRNPHCSNSLPVSNHSIDSPKTNESLVVDCQPSVLPPASLRDKVTTAEILFCLKFVQSHTNMSFSDNLHDLLVAAFPDSDIANGFKMESDKAAYTITYGLAPYFRRLNDRIVANCEFLVAQFDESLNKVSQRGQMDMHIRFIGEDFLVHTKYITSSFLGSCTAEDLFRALKSCLSDQQTLLKVLQTVEHGWPKCELEGTAALQR